MSEGAKRRPLGLGRGLNALLGDVTASPEAEKPGVVKVLPVNEIYPNQGQPRQYFDKDALFELGQSIEKHGLLQPIVVRQLRPCEYEIIAGERRWRAAGLMGITEIPAIVREIDERDILSVAIVENIQREQLNAVEEGEAYRRLIEEFGHSQDEVAKAVHKSRSHVANLMRLLDLPPTVRTMLADGRLSMGHARALLGVPDAEALAERIVNDNLSVRDVEAAAKQAKRPAGTRRPKAGGVADADLALLERQLGDLLGLKVGIAHEGKGGKVVLSYANLEQLDLICQRLTGERV